MPGSIHLSGWDDGFSEALRDRLERAAVEICGDIDSAEVTVGLGEGASGNIVILPSGLQPGDSGLVIFVHDVIVPFGGTRWGTGLISEWVRGIKKGGQPEFDPEEIHYWVHVRDVVEGICSVLIAEDLPMLEGSIDICGRRVWRNSDVVGEITQLWERYQNTLSHSHTVSSLSQISNPVKDTVAIPENRPKLGPFHDAIVDSGGAGWHPTVQMRTSLMELIAVSEIASD